MLRGFFSSDMVFAFQITCFHNALMLPGFEEPHRLSGLGGASWCRACIWLWPTCSPACFPDAPLTRGGVLLCPPPQGGGRQPAARSCTAGTHSGQAWGGQAQPRVEPRSLSSAGQTHLPHTFFTRTVLLVSLESNFTPAHPS